MRKRRVFLRRSSKREAGVLWESWMQEGESEILSPGGYQLDEGVSDGVQRLLID